MLGPQNTNQDLSIPNCSFRSYGYSKVVLCCTVNLHMVTWFEPFRQDLAEMGLQHRVDPW